MLIRLSGYRFLQILDSLGLLLVCGTGRITGVFHVLHGLFSFVEIFLQFIQALACFFVVLDRFLLPALGGIQFAIICLLLIGELFLFLGERFDGICIALVFALKVLQVLLKKFGALLGGFHSLGKFFFAVQCEHNAYFICHRLNTSFTARH